MVFVALFILLRNLGLLGEIMEKTASDLSRAREAFGKGNYSCVICKGGACYSSTKRGVVPLVAWIRSGVDLRGFSVCDKIVGKAAAMLFVLAGIKEVYAVVLSQKGKDYLEQHDVHPQYSRLVPEIINREGTGPCPMEVSVRNLEEPKRALLAVEKAIAELRHKSVECAICKN